MNDRYLSDACCGNYAKDIVSTLLTELLYPLQGGSTPLHFAAIGGHTTCLKYLLSTPGIYVNIKDKVSWSIRCCCMNNAHIQHVCMYMYVRYIYHALIVL